MKTARRRTADDAYTRAHAEALALLARITETVENQPAPSETFSPDWCDAGDAAATVEALQELSDRLHGEGEYRR